MTPLLGYIIAIAPIVIIVAGVWYMNHRVNKALDKVLEPTKATDPDYKCKCGSDDVHFRRWESSDGGHEDLKYECRACDKTWWAEGSDY